MGGWINIAVGRPHSYAQGMFDLGSRWIAEFVVADESRENRQPRGIRRGPSVGPTIVGIHIEECAGTREPFSLGRIVKNIVKLVEIITVAINDQQVSICAAAFVDVGWVAALNPIGLRDRFRRNRVEGNTGIGGMIHSVAFICILKLHCL